MESSFDAEDLVHAIAQQVVASLRPMLTRLRPSDHDALLDVKGLAQYLSVKPQWVYERIARREIPFFKIGKFPRFRRVDIDKWLHTLESVPVASPPSPSNIKKRKVAAAAVRAAS